MLNYNFAICYICPGEGKWQKGEKEKGLMSEWKNLIFCCILHSILNLKFLIHYEPVSSSSRETNFISLNKYLELTGSQQAGFIDWCRGEEWWPQQRLLAKQISKVIWLCVCAHMCVHACMHMYIHHMLVYVSAYICKCACMFVCVFACLLMRRWDCGPSCMFIDNAIHCHSACFSLVIERPSVVYWGDLVKGKLRSSLF